jgi:hypothetical protein
MTDPIFASGTSGLAGFAGAPIDPPPLWTYDPFADEFDADRLSMLEKAGLDHYREVGTDHAMSIVNRLIARRRGVEHEGIDLNTAVAQFAVPESDEQEAYAAGLCVGLAHEAEELQDMVGWIEEGIGDHNYAHACDFFARIAGISEGEFQVLVRKVAGAATGDAAGVAEMFRRAGGLSQRDVQTLVGQLDQLARTLSTQTGTPLPARLQGADQEQRTRADADALAVAIDQFSVLRALPALFDPGTVATLREQLAAHIAATYVGQRELLHRLPADRAAIVQVLLPDFAAQHTLSSGLVESEPDSRELTDLRATTDTVITALTVGTRTDVSALAAQITAQHQRDPALTRKLPSTQAGFVRHLTTVFEDAAVGPPPLDAAATRGVTTSSSTPTTARPGITTPPRAPVSGAWGSPHSTVQLATDNAAAGEYATGHRCAAFARFDRKEPDDNT